MEKGQVDITAEEAGEAIENMRLAFELIGSNAWQTVIERLYFEDESVRLVAAFGNLSLTKDQRENVQSMMYGIPMLQNFINKIIVVGRQAETDLKDFEAEAGREEQVQ